MYARRKFNFKPQKVSDYNPDEEKSDDYEYHGLVKAWQEAKYIIDSKKNKKSKANMSFKEIHQEFHKNKKYSEMLAHPYHSFDLHHSLEPASRNFSQR